jgi:hypothetical protein
LAQRSPLLSHCQQILIQTLVMPAPVPWSLAWCEDGELAAQDRFDLLQTLVCSETNDVQAALVAAVERLTSVELTTIASPDVTGLCA